MKFGIRLITATLAALACVSGAALGEERHEERERAPLVVRAPHLQLDERYHHDHYYPPRGYVMPALPSGSVSVGFRGDHYFFHAGVWLRGAGTSFSVVVPPIGIVVPVLPPAVVTLSIGGAPYYYANGVYYAPVPGQGYTVVAPPPGADVAQPVPPAPPAQAIAQPILYPRNGQSAPQTEAERQQCSTWATTQPSAATDAVVFQRALDACLDGRGYTMR